MIRFVVYESGKKADSANYPKIEKNLGWDNAEFGTLEEAQVYAAKWCWPYMGDIYGGTDYVKLQPDDEPYEYSGYGDTMEIRTHQK